MSVLTYMLKFRRFLVPDLQSIIFGIS